MRFTAGQSIGRYVIESLLGEGGMGEVYRARDSKLERSVALKVLRNDTDGSSEDWEHAVMRMQREAQAVAALSHPGIVAIYDIGEHEGAPFIAMELVGGQPLRDVVGKDAPLTSQLRILVDVARALGAAHEAGFVHRDIKPENILVRQDGQAKVLDFGIARKTSRHADPTAQTLDIQGSTIDAALVGMTADGAIVGTPAYMSPEQLRGETADARSDQFAWGVVAYELLTGRHPFHAEKGAIGMLSAILGETPAPLDGVPDEIASVILRALEKEPDKRWASMQEIVSHIEAFATDGDARKVPTGPKSEIDVSPSQTGSVIATPTRRSRARWIIAPIAGFVVLAAAASFAFRGRPESAVGPVVTPSVIPTATATAVTDLRIPLSDSAEALAEFRQGLQNIRDARWSAAAMAFNHARTADPGMAAAHLRFSIIQFSFDTTSARDAYRKALALRGTLSERDQGFLHAVEPMIMREPSDYGEAGKRAESLVNQYPGDAELIFWSARFLNHHSHTAESMQRVVDLCDRCVTLDARYADCWQTKADALKRRGDVDEARKNLDECIKVSENGIDCLLDKIAIESTLGHCAAIVNLAQQVRMKEPLASNASTLLAQALYYSGESEAVVRAAYEDAERRAREAGRAYQARRALLNVAVHYGEFQPGLDHAQFMARSINSPGPSDTVILYLTRAHTFLELGKLADAAAIADEFFVEWALRPGNREMMQTIPVMHSIRLRAGKISRSEYDKLRAAWLEKQPMDTAFARCKVWIDAYGFPAFSTDLANEAIARLPDMSSETTRLSGAEFSKAFDALRGRVYAIVGKYSEALPFLESASHTCTNDDTSLWHTQDQAFLGIAREATGDKPGACKAYDWVLSHWGKSKQSLTVKEVVKRSKKLGCGVSAGQ